MGRWWTWFWRPRKVVHNLTGRALPDGDVPGRFRRLAVERLVPGLRETSRCDDAIVYERPEERPAALSARNQRPGRCAPDLPAQRNRGKAGPPAVEPPSGAEPDEPAAPDGDADPPVNAAQLVRANRLADLHWRRPDEDPRTRKCPDCRDDGTCPQAAWAEAIIARCLWTYWQ